MCCSASIAIRTWPTSDAVSRGREHQLVRGPAGDDRGVRSVVTAVVGSMRRQRPRRPPPAGSCGRSGSRRRLSPCRPAPAGSQWVAVLLLAGPDPQVACRCGSTSDSPRVPSRASRCLVGAGVPDPQRVGAGDQRGRASALPPPPATRRQGGQARGRRSARRCRTAPSSWAVCTSTSSWAARARRQASGRRSAVIVPASGAAADDGDGARRAQPSAARRDVTVEHGHHGCHHVRRGSL